VNAAQGAPQPVGVIWRLAQPDRPRVPALTLSTRFGWLAAEDAAELAQISGTDVSPLAARLASGRRCWAAWASGQIASWGWVSADTEQVGGLGLVVRLGLGEAYIWDCATAPPFRRQGLYAGVLAHMALALLAEGVHTLWIGADFTNTPSQAGIFNAGFSPVADLVAAPPNPGERRRRGWLLARPGIGPDLLADARRVYLGDQAEAWLFAEPG
jgi:hypothetical protein